MARPTRSSMISPDDITIAHITTQTAQQMYLLGEDSGTGEDFSHRKDWIIDIMAHQSLFMAIDILRFAIMDNHVHFLLRTRPDIVRGWSDQEVADIKSAYESGIDCAEIARHHETTANTIQGHLHRMGVPARSQEKSDAIKQAWVARKAAAQ